MSRDVKLTFGPEPPVAVSFEAIETMTGLRHPWVQQSDDGGTARYFGLCQDCLNPMRLVNPFGIGAQTPHGRHVLRHVPGLQHDLDEILECNRFKGAAGSGFESEAAVITPHGRAVRECAVEHADYLIGILTEDIGVLPGRRLAKTLFAAFLDNLFYLWPNTTPGNVPWLMFRTLRTYPLYGQVIRQNSDTARAILRNVPAARLGPWSRLEAQPGQWIDIRFSLQHHRISGGTTAPPHETIKLVISSHCKSAAVTLLLEKTIDLRPLEFLNRVRNRAPPTRQGKVFIDIACEELSRHFRERPHLV